MNITPLISKLFAQRLREIDAYATNAAEIQHNVLRQLLSQAANTQWGTAHHYSDIKTYEQYQHSVPIQTYEDIKGYIERMRHGESDVLWPGMVKWYAKSSGTTNDKSKFIPVTKQGLHRIHYRGGYDSAATYFRNNPQSRFFCGKGLILGGSHAPNFNVKDSIVGDLSAIMIQNISPLVNLIRMPSKEIALLSDFEEKVERIAACAVKTNITNLSGVPSWMLAVLKRVLEISGKQDLTEVWPDLEVFFHGGISFEPYRDVYQQIIPSAQMHYMETYNASEGFFGIQTDPGTQALTLLIDYDVFYEFIPMNQWGSPNPDIVPLEGVELGKNYAMVISTSCGLWRYEIGDTVKFVNCAPYQFVITGRTKHFINAFGEELMVDNADKALAVACHATGASILDYTASPIYMSRDAICRHQWLVEFEQMPQSLAQFTTALDNELKRINSDYEAKRYKDITLQMPELIVAKQHLFCDWLKQKGKLGGQHKVPRLSNHRDIMDDLLRMNNP